jgi:hypothetical protein
MHIPAVTYHFWTCCRTDIQTKATSNDPFIFSAAATITINSG